MARDFLPCLLAVFRRKHLEQFIDLPHALRVFRVLLSQTRSHKFFSLGKDSLALRHLALSLHERVRSNQRRKHSDQAASQLPFAAGKSRPKPALGDLLRISPPGPALDDWFRAANLSSALSRHGHQESFATGGSTDS
jgi:hypothetical protein